MGSPFHLLAFTPSLSHTLYAHTHIHTSPADLSSQQVVVVVVIILYFSFFIYGNAISIGHRRISNQLLNDVTATTWENSALSNRPMMFDWPTSSTLPFAVVTLDFQVNVKKVNEQKRERKLKEKLTIFFHSLTPLHRQGGRPRHSINLAITENIYLIRKKNETIRWWWSKSPHHVIFPEIVTLAVSRKNKKQQRSLKTDVCAMCSRLRV